MLPSLLTMAVIGAEAADGAVRAQRTMSDCYNNHAFAWLNWLIILTAIVTVAVSLWQLLAAHRRKFERQAGAAIPDPTPARPGQRRPARRA